MEWPGKIKKLGVAIIVRAFKILVLIHKLHEDHFIEFEDELKQWGALILRNDHLMRLAIYHGFDENRLLESDIPENIADIHKDLKQRGYLTAGQARW